MLGRVCSNGIGPLPGYFQIALPTTTRAVMGRELSSMDYRQLKQLLSECRGAVAEICDSVSQTPEVQGMIQVMLGQDDLLEAFMERLQQDPAAGAQLFTAGFSTLVNSQTALAVERELLKRSASNN